MLEKTLFLSILIINVLFKCNGKECFDFQCFDGGEKKNDNCYKCQNVSKESQKQWSNHINEMIFIYKKLKRDEIASHLERKLRHGMYCCLLDDQPKFNTCSLTFTTGSKGGIPHFGMACSVGKDFLEISTCAGKQIGNRCCKQNHCNAPNHTEIEFMRAMAVKFFPVMTNKVERYDKTSKYLIIVFACFIALSLVIVFLFCYIRFFRKKYEADLSPYHSQNQPFYKKLYCLLKFFTIIRHCKKDQTSSVNGDVRNSNRKKFESNKLDSLDHLSCSGSGAGKPLMTPRTASTEITLIRAIGEGRFGTVWLGKWNGDDVAVKIFSTRDERSWEREKQIYQKNFLRHSNVLGYVATDSRDNGIATELWLVTDYHENGSLYDYLRSHVLTVEQAVKMVRSITNGLAHLHMEINGTELRPGIAHRDLKSRNILVKSCGECCIGDLGLAVRLNEDLSAIDGCRVGTRRYMAPEIILDKIVLPDSYYNGGLEAFKKADIYSYSLVLWEIVRRCECPSMKIASSPYEMPYQTLVSNDPSLEEMRSVVCEQKIRPPISPSWQNLNPMKEVSKCIKESWFDEPASRLTVMRLKKVMASVWTEVCMLKSSFPDIAGPEQHDSNIGTTGLIYKHIGTSNYTASTDFSPLSVTSNDIPNIAIRTKDNVLITDPFTLPCVVSRATS